MSKNYIWVVEWIFGGQWIFLENDAFLSRELARKSAKSRRQMGWSTRVVKYVRAGK